MKRNVDLTENMFFSSVSTFNSVFNSAIKSITDRKFPWVASFMEIASDDDSQKDAIIIAGDKEIRARIKSYREMDSIDYCDCCGRRMNLIPWDREIGICHECNDYYLKDEDRCKWR
jgi:exonuclease III